MKLEIISPESIVFNGDVSLVTLPGINGSFTVLKNHAPMISLLKQGKLIYRHDNTENEVAVASGFVEINKNVVTVSVELT